MARPKPQFVRDFDYANSIARIRDSKGKVFAELKIDDLDEPTARAMCLQQLVRAATEQAVEAMRTGTPEADARALVLGAYDKIVAGHYRPRQGKSAPGHVRHPKMLQKTATAVYEANFRSVSHGGKAFTFKTPDEAYTAIKWLWSQPADKDGKTGRMAYLEISKLPLVRARMGRSNSHPALS